MTHLRSLVILISVIVGISTARGQAPELRSILDLRGSWKFELGDDQRRAELSFDDSKWDRIYVPSPWENEGYPGYDGYAWYRKHFRIDEEYRWKSLYLRVGYVDDVSEVFLNGHMIGYQGVFPPHFMTSYATPVECMIPRDYVNFDGDNVIAVRVYDRQQAGGITHGDVAIYERRNFPSVDYDLSGMWKFKTGDDKAWAESSCDDSHWQDMKVPLMWDAQGYKEYDGFGWYRVKFRVPAELAGSRLILLLGRIDDIDEAYLNGELIGRTGRPRRGLSRDDIGDEYKQLRAYSIPTSLLKTDQENILAVRVQDLWMHGGIYDGPVGLIERSRYLSWKDKPRSVMDFFKQLFR